MPFRRDLFKKLIRFQFVAVQKGTFRNFRNENYQLYHVYNLVRRSVTRLKI